jgi:hypothetical protein
MKDKEVLQKAIEMAIENGYDKELKFVADFKENNPFVIVFRLDRETDPTDLNTVIFSHDFAKAFWGEKRTEKQGSINVPVNLGWQYHLQQMVLEENPIDYLRKFMPTMLEDSNTTEYNKLEDLTIKDLKDE